jgi:lipopolysaccharide/colanic/teichoic acid biosynthesis glycosyltransferase
LDLINTSDPNALRLVLEGRSKYYIVKRILDIVVSFLLLVLASPLMLLIAAMIFLYSPGPILFVQERVGAKRQLCGKYLCWKKVNFRCYKFRTMKINADPSIHQAYVKALIKNDQDQMNALQGETTEVRKLVHDPRITGPGMLLRKFSIDELPQFWNVLRGDMSLVGPRPAIPYEVEMYNPWHLRRLGAQPGITGLQQVTARCTADFDEQVRLDIEYIESQSLWLDMKIMLKTPLAIISTRGAH